MADETAEDQFSEDDAKKSFSEKAGAPPLDVNNPTDVDLITKRVEERERAWQDALALVIASPQGRRVLWNILDKSGMTAMETNVDHHARMAYTAGARDLALWLVREMGKIDPAAYPGMILEATRERETEQALHEARRIDAHRRPDARKLSS